jgi:hypothetical protein
MRVRDKILVSRPANGGLDVPFVFELDAVETTAIIDYLDAHFGGPCSEDVRLAAYHLAERGIPQGITRLVYDELIRRGRETEAVLVEPFVGDS